MKRSHIIKLKEIVETVGNNAYAQRFFETYPKASTIQHKVPCAALREISNGSTEDRTVDRYVDEGGIRRKTRKLYESTTVYQVDIFNTDIYAFINREVTDECHLEELIRRIAELERYTDESGNAVEVELRASGSFTDEAFIIENIYKGYVRVSFKDGIYSYNEQTPLMPTDIENYTINVEAEHGN